VAVPGDEPFLVNLELDREIIRPEHPSSVVQPFVRLLVWLHRELWEPDPRNRRGHDLIDRGIVPADREGCWWTGLTPRSMSIFPPTDQPDDPSNRDGSSSCPVAKSATRPETQAATRTLSATI
jgi:hypothetical protein